MSEKINRKAPFRTVITCVILVAAIGHLLITGLMVVALFPVLSRAPEIWAARIELAKIEDTNGINNTQLTVLTAQDALSGNLHQQITIQCRRSGNRSNVEDMQLKHYDRDAVRLTCLGSSGIQTLQATRIAEDFLTLNIETTLRSGNAELFIISDGMCVSRYPLYSGDVTITLNGMENADVVFKLGTECADIDISLTREYEK